VKKLIVLLLGLISMQAYAIVMSPGFKAGPIAEKSYTILVYSDLVMTEPEKNRAQSCDFYLKDKNNVCDIKFIMFQQETKDPVSKQQIGFWSNLVTMNIAEDQKSIKGMRFFNDSDVAKEFNGDSGLNAFISGSTSPFLEGHKFAAANFIYKKDVGIICEVLLFDDHEFTKTEPFMKLFHLFKFN